MGAAIDFNAFTESLGRLGQLAKAPALNWLRTEDGLRIAYRVYRPRMAFRHLIVFYHGGGACMDAGYDHLASAIAQRCEAAVCLVDIRGHGRSSGERGHTPSVHAAYRDIDQLLDTLAHRFPEVEIDLGGHSSGAGLVLNYMTRHRPARAIRRLLLVAPELGRHAGTHRHRGNERVLPFAKVRAWPFLVHAFSGGRLCGATRAVSLDYSTMSAEMRRAIVETYTVNMSLAVTPQQPLRQLAGLAVPTTILAAGSDELFDPAGVTGLARRAGNAHIDVHVVAGATHLDVLLDAHDLAIEAMNYPRPLDLMKAVS